MAIEAPAPTYDADHLIAVLGRLLRTPARAGPALWVYGDLCPGSLLLAGDCLTAIIDFGGLAVGDPACDLIVGWSLLPSPARRALRERVAVDDHTRERRRGWALPISRQQLPYYWDTNPALAANVPHTIDAVLTGEPPV